jgi:hypothetical protein
MSIVRGSSHELRCRVARHRPDKTEQADLPQNRPRAITSIFIAVIAASIQDVYL